MTTYWPTYNYDVLQTVEYECKSSQLDELWWAMKGLSHFAESYIVCVHKLSHKTSHTTKQQCETGCKGLESHLPGPARRSCFTLN